ncbi:hypothetical protein PAXRUDRAFT_22386 [Paxillus rubicundulus Ve08.2h10]|uniref:Uncharacterized protein n=1 Tax=Paxillus rubicundulus Ve08.2h10 TaxID=930991 RepID=A0A0D0BKB7_9AGAM|nr:hypothetical protein PAXRUDRAFT_22386 [Paxillus rubicundulus Ve08.2h10]
MSRQMNVSHLPCAPETLKGTKPDIKPFRGSLDWVHGQLYCGEKAAIKALYRWANRQRRAELTSNLVEELKALKPEVLREALRELKKPRRWICRIDQNSIMVPTVIQTLDDRRTFDVDGLLDCGATGGYIDEGFARAKGLNLERLPRAIPVYNADGTFNEGGPIRYVVHLRIQIRDHVENYPFAVANTGKSQLIIGYDWLRKHNPMVDWQTGLIVFNRCPPVCHRNVPHFKDPDERKEEMERRRKNRGCMKEEKGWKEKDVWNYEG